MGCRLPLALTFFPKLCVVLLLLGCFLPRVVDVVFFASKLFNQVLPYWWHTLLFLLSVLVTSDGTYLLVLWCGKIYNSVMRHLTLLSGCSFATVGRTAICQFLCGTCLLLCGVHVPEFFSTSVLELKESYSFEMSSTTLTASIPKHSSLPVLPSSVLSLGFLVCPSPFGW